MNSMSFLIAAAGYIVLTLFIFFNYPQSWRRNRMFVSVLIIWHVIGLTAVIMVFSLFKYIPYEGVRYEICRIGTCYYITTTLLAILFFTRYIYNRTHVFILERTGRRIKPEEKRMIADKRFHAILFLIISFAVYTAGYFNIDFLKETHYEVRTQAESAQEDLTICLVADIHAGSGTWGYTYDDLVKKIDDSDADVLLIAGDVFDETTGPSDAAHMARALKDIRQPKYGIYYIYGNHDNSIDDWAAREMKAMGAVVLEDEMALIGQDIQLIGRLDPKQEAASTAGLFEKLKPDPDKPILVLTHRPLHFQKMADLGCDLAMAGHTHGFNIPMFLGTNILGDMYYGIKQYDQMTAVTTSGVSGWGFHYKWPARSEVVTIHLTFGAEAE